LGVFDKAKKLNKEYKNDSLATVGSVVPQYERLATNALGIDFPLYGGLPEGRLVVFSGLEHSGKTICACIELAAYQRKYPNKVCVYVDVEHALDLEFMANMTGIDLNRLLYVNPENMSGEQIFDYILKLQDEDDIGLIVLDSLPALVSSRDYDTDVEEDKGMAASIAKPLAKFIRKINDQIMSKKNILILINQVRENGKTFTGATIYKEPCGHAPRFYASVIVRFGTRTFTKGDKVDLTDGEESDGFRLKFKIIKNKTASTQRGGGFVTFRYDSGLDWRKDMLEIAIKYDFIKRPNNQTYVLVDLESGNTYMNPDDQTELKFRGKQALLDFLETHIDFQNKYLRMLNDFISHTDNKYGSLLDARESAEIDAQERSVRGQNEQTEEELMREMERDAAQESVSD